MAGTSKQRRPKVAVVIEGGLVQCIVSDAPEQIDADFVVIDYDTDGTQGDEVFEVPQSDGSVSDACGYIEPVNEAVIDLDSVFRALTFFTIQTRQ